MKREPDGVTPPSAKNRIDIDLIVADAADEDEYAGASGCRLQAADAEPYWHEHIACGPIVSARLRR